MEPLRIATFNAAGALDSDRRFYSRRGTASTADRVRRARASLAGMAEVFRRERLDLIALQEVDVCHNGHDTLHQATELARLLDKQVSFLPGFDYDLLRGRITVTTGVAVLSAFPIERVVAIEFPQRHVRFKRKVAARVLGAKRALHCEIRVGGERLSVVSAHLTHDNDRQKEMELEILFEHCAAHAPCLLLGDLNTTPSSTRSPAMREPGQFATDRCEQLFERFRGRYACDPRVFDPHRIGEVCSYPSTGPDLKLDYLLLFAGSRPLALSAERVLARIDGSNHLAVTARIDPAGAA